MFLLGHHDGLDRLIVAVGEVGVALTLGVLGEAGGNEVDAAGLEGGDQGVKSMFSTVTS